MSYVHYISLFDYKSFQETIRPYRVPLEQQAYEELRKRTVVSINRLNLRYRHLPTSELSETNENQETNSRVEWPFKYHGAGGVPEVGVVQTKAILSPQTIGYWFLLILGEYVYPPFPIPTTWGLLAQALRILGWNSTETELLRIGQPLETMVGFAGASDTVVSMTPTHASKSGWISVEQATYFYRKLVPLREDIENFDVRQFQSLIDKEDPLLVRDFRKWLLKGYASILAHFDQAIQADLGIFTSLSLQY